jgi:hypothetical protein
MQPLPVIKRGFPDGLDVRRLQGLLVAAGQLLPGSRTNNKPDGPLDGQFGDETEKALKAVTGSIVAGTREWKHLMGA